MASTNGFPSIWLRSYKDWQEWQDSAYFRDVAHEIFANIDDRLIFSRRPFSLEAYCSYCETLRRMHIDWRFAGASAGAVSPAWTEIAICSDCGLNSRMRAVWDFVTRHVSHPS